MFGITTKRLDKIEKKQDAIVEILYSITNYLEKITTKSSLEETSEINEETEKDEPIKTKRKVDMSNRARSLIGQTINGWTITGEKLEVVATKDGHDMIRMAGMKKKENLLELLK